VIGKVIESKLKIANEGLPSSEIHYKVQVKNLVVRDAMCFGAEGELETLEFVIGISESVVPTGHEGLFFLNLKQCELFGFLGKYSAYKLRLDGEVDERGRPLEDQGLFRVVDFGKKLTLTDVESGELVERIRVLDPINIGSTTFDEVIKAKKLLKYISPKYDYLKLK